MKDKESKIIYGKNYCGFRKQSCGMLNYFHNYSTKNGKWKLLVSYWGCLMFDKKLKTEEALDGSSQFVRCKKCKMVNK